jgi:AraC-like DNA-binding protein
MPQSQALRENRRARPPGRPSAGEHPAIMRGPIAQHWNKAPFGSKAESLDGQPIRGEVVLHSLPGLNLMWANHGPLRAFRTKPLLMNGADSILFSMVTAPRSSVQFGRDFALNPGEVTATGNIGAGSVTYPSACTRLTVTVPQAPLRPLLRDKSTHFLHVLPSNSAATRLLVGYLDVLKDVAVPPELEQSVVAHACDLLAVAIGATQDGLEIAKTRGIRAARLQAIKRDVIRRLDTDLSVDAIAASHRLTARYVQMLFEDEGTTFTSFVREQRLSRARTMLVSPRFDHKRIGEIAYEVGFNDLSYFVRAFRRQFGVSPGEARRGT